MKRLLQTLMLGMMLAAFALPALAQNPAATPQPAAGQLSQEEKDARSAVYKKFIDTYNPARELLKGDPSLAKPGNKEAYDKATEEANQFAMEYLQKWPNPTGDKATDDIANYLKTYVTNYEKKKKEARKTQLAQLFKDKKYDEGFTLGKQILADEPDDLSTLYSLVTNDFFAVVQDGKKSFNGDTVMYAKKAIRLLESGKSFAPGQALSQKDKDEYLGRLNYALGIATIENAPADAVGAFIKVASIEGVAKKDARTYFLLAEAYKGAEYTKLATDFSAQCKTEEQLASPTCAAMKERLNLVVDRIIDAYARAVSLSGTTYAAKKAEWMSTLSDYYKYRHEGKVDGLDTYIAGIVNQPLPGPLPPMGATPAPTTATPAPSTTPAVGTGNGAATSSSTTATTTPATTAPKTTTAPTTAPKTTTAPKAATTPATTPKTTPKKKAHAGRY